MEANLKKTLKSVTLGLRHLLEGWHDTAGVWQPGDLENRLASLGVRRDRKDVPADELQLTAVDRSARRLVDSYVKLRVEAGVPREEAVADYLREAAYTWANRLIALRCMESRDLIDAVILQQEVYGGRSLEHHRLAQRQPELCTGEDDGLFAVLDKVFAEQAERLPMLFAAESPGIALRPSPAAIKDCFGLLSLAPETLRKHRISNRTREEEGETAGESNPFVAPDALGWAYQYWNTEEKERVFTKVRTVKGAKIAGADIIPATQLYTEDYMVKFLVQNSLGATWLGMRPESRLAAGWEYYVRDTDRAPVTRKPVREITFLDPACGSGHFLLEAFDLFYAMYEEEGELTEPEQICASILTHNLFGIDIDGRAVQIAEAALWMKAAERAFDFRGGATNLVAAAASHLKGPAWEAYLASFEKEPSVARVLRRFAATMEHIDEIGSLARPAEDLAEIVQEEHATWESQVRAQKEANFLFGEMRADALSGQLPFNEISHEQFGHRLFNRAQFALDAFMRQASESGDLEHRLLASETTLSFRLLAVLGRKYTIIAANPPYMGTTQLTEVVSETVATYHNSPDLYCALMLRWIDLQEDGGIAALITRADYLTQSECKEMRRVLLDRASLTLLVRLENGVFRDLSNPNAIFFSMQVHSVPRRSEAIVSHVSVANSEFEEKAIELRDLIASASIRPSRRQHAFERLPRNTFALNLPDWAYDAYEHFPQIREFAAARQGLITGKTDRFLRYRWETPLLSGRWRVYAKGGPYRRWFGNDEWHVDWESRGARLRNFVDSETGRTRSRVQNVSFYGRRGATWSSQTISAFAARVLENDSAFDTTGSSVFLDHRLDTGENFLAFVAVLNSPAFGVLFQAIQPGVHYGEGYLETLPCPDPTQLPAGLANQVSACIGLQKSLLAAYPTSSQFRPTRAGGCTVVARAVSRVKSELIQQAQLYAIELDVWDQAEAALGVPREARTSTVRRRTTLTSADLFPTVWNCAGTPTATIQEATQNRLEEACMRTVRDPAVAIAQIDALTAENVPARQISYWIESDVSVHILELLGHRWSSECVDAPLPTPPDSDGIISFTPLPDEETLAVRLGDLFSALEIDTTAFQAVVGPSIEEWIANRFFRFHSKQFEGRPVAWQLQSSNFTTELTPAFACLMYYHKVDVDALPKIRSQYIGVIRPRLETEQRGIHAFATDARSDQQLKRLAELEDTLAELQKFDATLAQVAASGFGPDRQLPALRQFAVDDAWLALKTRWLTRLSELAEQQKLAAWRTAADDLQLHPELSMWIEGTMTHLQFACAQAGPAAPQLKDLSSPDPTAAGLAPIIQAAAEQLIKQSLSSACDRWWDQLDEAVFAPLKEEIKSHKAEQKQAEEQLKADPEPSAAESRELKIRVKELKAEVKQLDQQLKAKTAASRGLREKIEAWRPAEPHTWGDWLRTQPLFDQISSLDHRQPPPTTIAEFVAQESRYAPDINDGVRVNIAPLQKAGLLAADVLAAKDLDRAIADRAEWRADERRWVREGKLPQPGWWPELPSGEVQP